MRPRQEWSLGVPFRGLEPGNDRGAAHACLRCCVDGKPVVMVQLLHEIIPALHKAVVGFDLLGGRRMEQAKKLADLLNELYSTCL